MGDVVWRKTPVVSGPLGWVCTATGNPGMWTEFAGLYAKPAYTLSNIATVRALDGANVTTAELADVLGTLIADLKTAGLLQ